MKKVFIWILAIILAGITFYLGYDYKNNQNPKTYYKVYLNNEVLGIIDSEKKLNKFIDKQSDYIKNKYKVNKVYSPEGLYIETLSSYGEEVTSIEDMFKLITDKATLRIDGYQVSFKSDDENTILYLTSESILKESIVDLIKTFVGASTYESYLNETQLNIVDTGSLVNNIYIQNDITIKKTKVAVTETIYQDSEELTRFLLFGPNAKTKKYTVKIGDTISKVADTNEINTEEFLLSNPQYTDKTNLLHVGDVVNINVTNPQLKVVSESYEVVDIVNAYSVEVRYDPNKYIGDDKVIQIGENGLYRVSQNVQKVNGSISYIDPIDKIELKPTVNKIVVKGKKEKPSVGDINNWRWPSNPGYTITSDFQWRINPITHVRERHSGIDIAGTGYGSPIYVANNGVITDKKITKDYGLHIIVNHNNGYYTLYAHMSRFANVSVGDIVMRGQVIGYVGSSGYATGPHIHFELWEGCRFCRIDPLTFYR